MLYTFIKADITAALLYNLNIMNAKIFQIITNNVMEKNLSWEANSCSAIHSIPSLLQNTWIHYYFHHSHSHPLT